MKVGKVAKDWVARVLIGKSVIPTGLLDLHKYFKSFGSITFDHHKEGDVLVSVSRNFKYGTIVAHGKTKEELDSNIRDAILTAFEVPSAYKKEAAIVKEGELKDAYALA